MSAAQATDTPSFLVINVSRIGDTLLATPAIRAIAKAYPASHICVLAHPKRAEVLYHLPFVANVGGVTKNRVSWRGWLGRKRFDFAIVYGFDPALVRYALRVAYRVVAFRQRDARLNARLYRAVQPPPFQSLHAVRHALRLTDALDIAPVGFELSYQVLQTEQDQARAKIKRALGDLHAYPLVGLQLASFHTKAFRDWPVEQFVALARRLVEHFPRVHFFLFGSKADRVKTTAFAEALPTRTTVLAGELSLRETAAMMSLLDLYVGVDTGPSHLMGAMNRPMVVLYHAHSPARLLAPLDHALLQTVDHPRAGETSDTGVPMSEITVDMVWAKVEVALRLGTDVALSQFNRADAASEHSPH